MGQIKSNQIVEQQQLMQNLISPLPRDLFVEMTASTNIESNNSIIAEQSAVSNIPATPAILGVKEQQITFSGDGSSKVDLILQVEDVATAVEYDVRVTKIAG